MSEEIPDDLSGLGEIEVPDDLSGLGGIEVPDDLSSLGGGAAAGETRVPSSLGGPRGLAPGEKVPTQLRILAMNENLGNLHSVHSPATRMARFALKSSRIYLFDKGFVVSNGRGGLGLFRWEHCKVTEQAGTWLVTRTDGPKLRLTKHWTEHAELGRAIAAGAAAAAGDS